MNSLSGKRILVTRAREQAASLCNQLTALGAEPIPFPTIEIGPLADYAALDNAIAGLTTYQWLIFTSVNAVAAFWARVEFTHRPFPVETSTLKIAAVGPGTAGALESHGLPVQLIPDDYVAESILAKIGDVAEQTILLLRPDLARETLAVELARRGARVDAIAAYRTLPARPDPQALTELQQGVDVITFTSSSTVHNFIELTRNYAWPKSAVACIGPITARTAREHGLSVDILAADYTTTGLVTALVDHFLRN